MRRLFWTALGATAGVLAVRRLRRVTETLTPQGLADAAGGLGAGLRVLAEEVRVGMAERERELRDALGLDGAHELPPEQAATVVTHPTARTRAHPTGRTVRRRRR